MRQKSNRLFLGTFIGLVVMGSALLLSLPPLFSPHDPYRLWLAVVLGGLTLLLAVALIIMGSQGRGQPARNRRPSH